MADLDDDPFAPDPKHPAPVGPYGERLYVIPISCWRPILGTGIPADAEMYPPGCPDAHWCRGNRCCFWKCNQRDEEFG